MEEGEKEDREHGGKVGRRRRRADTSRALSVPKSPRASPSGGRCQPVPGFGDEVTELLSNACLTHAHTCTHTHTHSLSGAPRVPLSSPGCGGPSTGGWGAQPP